MKLIDKSAVVAEIEKRIKEISKECEESKTMQFTLLGKINALENLLPFLDTLKVKEVDLEKEIHLWMEDNTCGGYCSANIRETAEHFFDIGLKAQKEE